MYEKIYPFTNDNKCFQTTINECKYLITESAFLMAFTLPHRNKSKTC